MQIEEYRKAILIDAMFTIFVPLVDKWTLYRSLLKSMAGIEASRENIKESYNRRRRESETLNPIPKGKFPRGYYHNHWTIINKGIIADLAPDFPEAHEVGEKIVVEVMGNDENYTVPVRTLDFLEEANSREYSLYLATNHERIYLDRLFETYPINKFFQSIFVSDEIGYKKPDPRFFQEALREVNFPLENVSFVGNNPINDMEGSCLAGIIHRFLYDPREEHSETKTDVQFTRIIDLFEIFDYFY